MSAPVLRLVRCPLCRNRVLAGELVASHHPPSRLRPKGDNTVCEASGWIVEAEDRI